MHLTPETIARLVDEPAEAVEAAHLRDCLVCRRELAAMREQTQALAALAAPPPAGAWERLERRLTAEGLLATAPPARMQRSGSARLRWAAAVALLLTGGVGGALLRGAAPGSESMVVAELPPPLVEHAPMRAPGTSIPAPRHEEPPLAESVSGARLVSTVDRAVPAAPSPRRAAETASVRVSGREADAAARDLVEAQAAFVAALSRLAAVADPATGNDPATRLAALDRLLGLTAAALERAPGDPIINAYHLGASAERESVRRQVERDAQITWF
jgi:hypothetical protein